MDTNVSGPKVDWQVELSRHFKGVEPVHITRAKVLASDLDVHAVIVQLTCEATIEARIGKLSDEVFAQLVQAVLNEQSKKDRSWHTMLLVQKNYKETRKWLNKLPE